MTRLGDDDGQAHGEGLEDGDGEAFLAAGETEQRGVAECGEFFVLLVERAGEQDAVLEFVSVDAVFEVGPGAVVGACDDELEVGHSGGDGGEAVGEIVEALFVVESGEEEDEGGVAELGVSGAESAGGRGVVEGFDEDAVGDDFDGCGESEEGDEVAFVAVEGVNEGGAVEHSAEAEGEGEAFFEAFLGEGPRVEHAGGADDVRDAVGPGDEGSGPEEGFPDAMKVEDVGVGKRLLEDDPGARQAEHVKPGFLGAVEGIDEVDVADAAEGGGDAVGGVADESDVVPCGGLSRGEMCRHRRGAPLFGVEVLDGVEDAHGGVDGCRLGRWLSQGGQKACVGAGGRKADGAGFRRCLCMVTIDGGCRVRGRHWSRRFLMQGAEQLALPASNLDVPGDHRPALVMLANSVTPYRLAFHRRIAAEIPELLLLSVFTHDESNSPWKLPTPPEINARFFGPGEPSSGASRRPVWEWKKAGRIVSFLERLPGGVGGVILHGYNDAGRVRILRWCADRKIPCFVWGDSNAASDQVTGLKRAVKRVFVRYVFARCTGVMACGSLGRRFMESYGADPDRIFYMPYEPDYEQIRSLSREAIAEAARRFGLEPGRRRVVYSGRLASEKRVDLLLRAFVNLAADRPGWDLVVVGDGKLRGELQALVPEGLASRVKWLGFQGDQAVVSAVYRNADVLCLPSDYEPWALVINEAVAAGLAVVASDVVGAAAELVKDGVNGKRFKSRDLQDCERALRWVTDEANVDRLRAGSAGVLEGWRQEADPVEGIRKAFRSAGVKFGAG